MSSSGSVQPAAPRRPRLTGRVELVSSGGGVSRIELFLDLVFVYAFLNVTNLMANSLHPRGLLQGMLVILLLWRCWTSFALAGNIVRLERGILPFAAFGVTTIMLLIGVAVPEVFTDRRGGLPGPLVFAIGFILVRGISLLTMNYPHHADRQSPQPVLRAWLPLAGSGTLLLCAAWLPTQLGDDLGLQVRLGLFLAATIVDYTGLWAIGVGSLQIRSARHWAERHALIILVALGETIISVGISRGLGGGPPITWPIITGSVLSIVIVAILWWTYFDIARLTAEHALESSTGRARSLLGRDAYSLLHLPMIGGLILLALGLKHTLGVALTTPSHDWDALDVLILYGGVVLYLLGLLAFEWRTIRLKGRGPMLGTALVLAALPIALRLPALGSLALLAVGVGSLVIADRTVFRRRHEELHRMIEPRIARSTGTTSKELFVDLVFVFTFIQVTVLMGRERSALGIAQGLTVLALLWWAWCSYAWLANLIRTEAALVRITVLAVMALTLLLGIAIPQAFTDVPGGLPGPVIVVASYIGIRLLLYALFWLVTRDDPDARSTTRRGAVPTGLSLLLLAVGAFSDLDGASLTALWLTAVLVDLGGSYLTGAARWQVRSVEHWTDRYALIMLIAIGEAIIATGVAVDHQPLSTTVLLTTAFSTISLATLWWSYFDSDVLIAHDALQRCPAPLRAALARDAYTYLHLPMVAGLMLFAFGVRHSLLPNEEQPESTPTTLGHYMLFYSVVVYLAANQLFWWRTQHRLSPFRICGALVVAILAPLTTSLSAHQTLGLLAIVGVVFAIVETVSSATQRRELHRAH